MTQSAPEDAQSTFSGTREVDPRYALDEAALDRWLAANVEGYAGPLTVRQFKGGQSNPTYRFAAADGRRFVLRRKPPGKLLPSAHAVDREFKVMHALHGTGFPVPLMHVLWPPGVAHGAWADHGPMRAFDSTVKRSRARLTGSGSNAATLPDGPTKRDAIAVM